jgi:hypothetical protein
MKHRGLWLILAVIVLSMFVPPAAGFADPAVRKARLGFGVHLDRGVSSGDACAQIGAGVEYGLAEHLGIALGYVYLDGATPLQAHGVEAAAKYYVFGTELDLLVAAFAQPMVYAGSFRFAFTGKLGAEWQSPWKFFVGIEGSICFEPDSIGYLGGSYLGIRL